MRREIHNFAPAEGKVKQSSAADTVSLAAAGWLVSSWDVRLAAACAASPVLCAARYCELGLL